MVNTIVDTEKLTPNNQLLGMTSCDGIMKFGWRASLPSAIALFEPSFLNLGS